ncbi:MAG: DUF1428 domain-containing protein [Proteobacteria bacterium]|nr:MAG: DUF1428 domain-containing protein [Pseudomonadota bacterium]
MPYVDGFVIAVPRANKAAYLEQATWFSKVVKEYGATRVVECWSDEVPDGKVTDFKMAVKATAEEAIVFSWIEYPSKEIRDAATAKVMADERMEKMKMPFDGSRMIVAGFDSILEA